MRKLSKRALWEAWGRKLGDGRSYPPTKLAASGTVLRPKMKLSVRAVSSGVFPSRPPGETWGRERVKDCSGSCADRLLIDRAIPS
jgi:hypothetical protein